MDMRARFEDDEDRRIPGRAAFGDDDRVPLARARDAGNAGLDPAKSARVVEVLVQESCGSMSP